MSAKSANSLLVQIQNGSLGYSKNLVLQAVDIEIRQGEYWFFLGPNGVGKTSLLRVLLGLLPLKEGQIKRSFTRGEVGFVPQSCKLNSALPTTVREFVSLGLVGLHIPKAQKERQLEEALQKTALEKMIGKSYHALSGGQKQRALVARALIRRPRLLILDEPTNGLDVRAEENFMQTLDELNKADGLSILFVSHDLALAKGHASHVALFSNNSLQAGRASNLLKDLLLSSVFGISLKKGRKAIPPMRSKKERTFKKNTRGEKKK